MSILSNWIEANKSNPDNELAVRNYTLNKEYYEREFAKALLEGNIVECHSCGYPETIGNHLNDPDMVKHKVCFNCWFWLHHMGLKDGPSKRSIIVDGTHYVDGGDKPKEKSAFLGVRWFKMVLPKNRRDRMDCNQ
jgi:hypothetical protein